MNFIEPVVTGGSGGYEGHFTLANSVRDFPQKKVIWGFSDKTIGFSQKVYENLVALPHYVLMTNETLNS